MRQWMTMLCVAGCDPGETGPRDGTCAFTLDSSRTDFGSYLGLLDSWPAATYGGAGSGSEPPSSRVIPVSMNGGAPGIRVRTTREGRK